MVKYRMTFDLHTHTVMKRSDGREILHAKGTVEENVLAAREKGLSCIGISNHGPGHITYGLPEDGLPALRGQIEEARQKYPDIKILLGIEANIINPSGLLDVQPEDFERFNYIMAGYHYGIFGEEPARAAKIHGGNWLYTNLRSGWDAAEKIRKKFGGVGSDSFEDALRRLNTELMVAAVRRNRPRVLTHPGDKGPFDIDSIARACQETGTWMEINNYHQDLSAAGILIAAKYDVSFVIGSDAHTPEKVGTFEKALERAQRAGISPERIVNIEEIRNAARPAGNGGKHTRRQALDELTEEFSRPEKTEDSGQPPAGPNLTDLSDLTMKQTKPPAESPQDEFRRFMENAERKAKQKYNEIHGIAPKDAAEAKEGGSGRLSTESSQAKQKGQYAESPRENFRRFMENAEAKAKQKYNELHGITPNEAVENKNAAGGIGPEGSAMGRASEAGGKAAGAGAANNMAAGGAFPRQGQARRQTGLGPVGQLQISPARQPVQESESESSPALKSEPESSQSWRHSDSESSPVQKTGPFPVGKTERSPAPSGKYSPVPGTEYGSELTPGEAKVKTDETSADRMKHGISMEPGAGMKTDALLWGEPVAEPEDRSGDTETRSGETGEKQRTRYRISEDYRKKDMGAVYRKRRHGR